MKYNFYWILKALEKNTPLEYLFFWGHKPSLDGKISKSVLSQWWTQDFEVGGEKYFSAEHWMMAEKARLFKDEEVRAQILSAPTPAEAKKLGRKVRNFDFRKWEKYRYQIVVEGNVHKFGQNEDLKAFLLGTAPKVLVEASPTDTTWGIGMSQHTENIQNPKKWNGLNLLGFALMEARDRLIST